MQFNVSYACVHHLIHVLIHEFGLNVCVCKHCGIGIKPDIVYEFGLASRKPELLKGVYDMGFNAPSKIQETALPVLLGEP